MRTTITLLFLAFLLSLTACRTDFDFVRESGNLRFSRDTVYLDTVFTDIGSSTYTLKVYNRSDKNIAIPSVSLGKGQLSKYRITVDGMTGIDSDGNGIGDGKEFADVELLAKDSLFIFIETTANIGDANPADFLYTDQILFGTGTKVQKVELVTLIQDAVFLYPQKFEDGTTERLQIGDRSYYGFFLDENDPAHGNEYILTNEKPYVIYGFAAVASGKTLEIQAGARLHFHAESGLVVADGSTLKVNGMQSNTEDQENEVIIEGDRLEPGFSNIPGQWYGIWLTSGSTGHEISHLTVKNATIGLRIENNSGTMTVKNSQIFNCSLFGLYAVTANIEAFNLVVNNAGLRSLNCIYGGTYSFTHCTFNNNWGQSSYAVYMDNAFEGATPAAKQMTSNFNNTIIYGSNQIQLNMFQDASAGFEANFDNCLIKFNDFQGIFTGNPLFDFNDTNLISKSGSEVFDPEFLNPDRNKLNIGEDSAARGKANFSYSAGSSDILHRTRTEPSDIGAFNWEVFEE